MAGLLTCSVIFTCTLNAENETVADDSQNQNKIAESETASTNIDNNDTAVFEIGEIVIKDKSIASIEEAATTTEITSKTVKAHGDKTLDEALQSVPGIKIERHNKGYSRLKMRGFDQDRVMVMVDGIPINDVYEANVDLTTIPVTNISRIIVNKGVSSALYGNNGSVGSVNVITKRPEKLFAEVNGEYGLYNNYTVNFAHGMPIGKFYYWVTGTMMNSDGYKVSSKLDKAKRLEWLNKIVRADLYSKDTTALKSVNQYLNDTGLWDHDDFTKYQSSMKIGYNFTDAIEAGISASGFYNTVNVNSFRPDCFSTFDLQKYLDGNTATKAWSDPSFTSQTKGAFRESCFYWPEQFSYSIAPYFTAKIKDFSIKGNIFYNTISNNLNGYAAVDNSEYSFPPSVYKTDGKPYSTDRTQSIWTDNSYGFHIYPSYQIAKWNRLNSVISYSRNGHQEEEKAFSDGTSANVIAIYGTGKFKTKDMQADVLTIGLEDEIKIKEIAAISVGVSYDAQNFNEYKKRSNEVATLNQMVEKYIPKDDSMIYGTRDAFSPVLGVIIDPIKDLLRFQTAGSIKSKFPTLSNYANITSELIDKNLKTETSYNCNAGFQLFFLDNDLTFRNDYFFTMFDNKIESIYNPDLNTKTAVNLDKVISQGIESTITGKFEELFNVMDLDFSVGYVFMKNKNYDKTKDVSVNKGDEFELTPEHQIVVDLGLNFITKTSLNFWGNYSINQFRYAMLSKPTDTNADFSTQYFTKVDVNDPLMINVKVSQKVWKDHFELYIMCKNILDDYNADPFNPGAGRMFYFGGSAKL